MLLRSCPPRLRLLAPLKPQRRSQPPGLLRLTPSRVLFTGCLIPEHHFPPFPQLPALNHTSRQLPSLKGLPAMGPSGQSRLHSGHSHSHTHDNTYLTSTNKKDAGVRITRLGLYVNLGMAVSKGIGGYYFNSQALVADAFHALTDLVSDFMTLATISIALRPPTRKYPNGFGKVESFGSLVVSGLLLAGGVLMGQHACGALYHEFFPAAVEAAGHAHGIMGHSHSHSAKDLIPNINAAWLAAGSIIVKEYLYRASEGFPSE